MVKIEGPWQCNVDTTGAANKNPFTCKKQPTEFYRNVGDRCVDHRPRSNSIKGVHREECDWQSPSGWIGQACDKTTKTHYRTKDTSGTEWDNIWGNGNKCREHSPIVIKNPTRRDQMFWFRRKEFKG